MQKRIAVMSNVEVELIGTETPTPWATLRGTETYIISAPHRLNMPFIPRIPKSHIRPYRFHR